MDHVSAHPDDDRRDDDTSAGGPPSPADHDGPDPMLDGLRTMWETVDPVPAGLADRVGFALEVEALTAPGDLDLELMRLLQQQPAGAGSRGDEVRTITFGSDSTTVMLALTDVEGGFRVDAWVAPGGRRRVEVRTAAGSQEVECDDSGRFTLPVVPPGHFQLVLEGPPPTPGAGAASDRPVAAPRRAVVTPALSL